MSAGFVRVGLVPNTSDPVPVSSLITPKSCNEVVAAKIERLFVVRATVPARSGKAIVLAVVNAVCNTPVIPVVPVTSIFTFLVLSAESTKNVVVSDRDLFVNISVVAFPTRVSVASGRVQVLAAVIVFVNRPVNVLATFRSQNVASRNVFNPLFICADARTISPDPAGVAKVQSHRRNVVVLFGGVGTAPPTVAVIVGKSLFKAVVNTQATSL